MAASPKYKVYTSAGEYVAACKYAEDAAAVASLYGEGSTVRSGHRKVLFADGIDGISGGESVDDAAALIHERERA